MSPWFHQLVLAVVIGLMAFPVVGAENAEAVEPGEQLVIFVSSEDESSAATAFAEEHLPRLRAAAAELGLASQVVDLGRGAPPEVTLTPLIVYQDDRGRSLFQARYADTGKLQHFIRTSRAIPPTAAAQRRNNAAVLSQGRARTVAPIKLTALTGYLSDGHDAEAFHARAEAAIFAGFERFEQLAEIEVGASNRLFYMNFHPYRSAAGELLISLALFSQFNCIEPVFERFEAPVSGPWEEAEQVFAEAAAVLEAEVLRQISSSPIGDGFQPVPAAVPVVAWGDLGLALPPARARRADEQLADIELPVRWRIEAPVADAGPRLVFRFPAPLERYSGEVRDLSGELILAEDRSLAGAGGWLEVATDSVTMGETTLDEAIHEKMIRVLDFPASRFDLESVEDGTPPLTFGRPVPIVAHGRFSLLGLTIPVEVKGEVEPIIGADDAPRLQVRATYSIRLSKPFGIEGPDGPAPANDTLVFHLNFTMREA
ncbi:MAG: hypothetical protein AAF657_09030 [Acidobacteriota bacterium]